MADRTIISAGSGDKPAGFVIGHLAVSQPLPDGRRVSSGQAFQTAESDFACLRTTPRMCLSRLGEGAQLYCRFVFR